MRRHRPGCRTFEAALWCYLAGLLGADLLAGGDTVLAAWAGLAPILGAFGLSKSSVLRLGFGAAVTSGISLAMADLTVSRRLPHAGFVAGLVIISGALLRIRQQSRDREDDARNRIEAERRQAERITAFYQAVLSHSPDVVCVAEARSGKMRWRSGGPKLACMLGYPDDWFDTHDVRDILTDEETNRGGVASTPAGERLFIEGGENLGGGEFKVAGGDGSTRYLSVRYADLQGDPLVAGVVTVVRDVTAEKLLVDRLAETEDHYRRLVEVMREGVLRIGADRRVSLANPQMCEFFGWDAESIVGRPLDELWPVWSERRRLIEAAMVSSTAPVFDQLPDGPVGRRHLLLSATRVVGDGIPGAAVIVTAVEVTVLCRALDQLAAEHRKAQAAVEARDWLLNQVSHELRTPLTPIMALADLLIHGQLDPEQVVRTGSTIFEAATHMRTVAEQILDLGRRQGTEPAGGNGEIELCELVETAAKLAGVPVLVQGAGQVVSDRLGLLQVLINLLANAEIHGRPPVWVTIRPGRHGVETIIRDHGPGIVDRQRGEIFERFTRRPGESSGAGLGLAIVREILDGLGGTITAGAPDDGGPGAVFTVTLPPPDNDPGKGTVIFLDRRERQLPGQAGRRVPGGIETARAPKGGCSG